MAKGSSKQAVKDAPSHQERDGDGDGDGSSSGAGTGTRGNKRSKGATAHPFFQLKRPRTGGADKGATGQAQPSTGVQWREVGKTWVGTFKAPGPAPRFAAFDLDNTLIRVKGKNTFPKDSDDWVFIHPEVPGLLRNIHQQGYKIVVISNQAGLKPKKGTTALSKRATDYRLKISKIAKQLDVPFTILAATGKDYMRKPSPGMWFLAEMDNGGVAVDRASSFYVGDAAGRPGGWKHGAKADFSDSDLAFALNAKVPFYTPEHVFTSEVLAKDDPLPLPAAAPLAIARFAPNLRGFSKDDHDKLLNVLSARTRAAEEQRKALLVLLVGPPACGKSTFATDSLEPRGFTRINMDTLKTAKKCEAAVRAALGSGTHAVVDNTNADPSARRAYIEIANSFGVECVCIVFEHKTRDLAVHNNNYRAQLSQARYLADDQVRSLDDVPVAADRIPDVAYHTFFKRFSLPTASEGFADVLHHSFFPIFDSPADEQIWHQYF
ncbi:PNK3P-domain-containing protein [Martensiomyces pterosporus]|nr:PNK3P-domain-containing protein [Martensiomyces pterosporus]